MKRLLFIILFCLTVLTANLAFASESVQATLNKEYTIKYNDEQKSFYNAKVDTVFPILYDSTNLPLRNITELFDSTIEWDPFLRDSIQ